MDKRTLINLALYLVPMILSLSVHEFAHAFVASKLGDDTPEREERLTLSPLAHIDPFGTLLLPALSIIFSGGAFFGWARPVNVNPTKFRRDIDMRRGMALTAVAGPLSNLLLAVLSIGLLAVAKKTEMLAHMSESSGTGFVSLLSAMFSMNVGLCIFNLLPIPPFDGSRLLPRSADGVREQLERFKFPLLMLVLMVPAVRAVVLDAPMQFVQRTLIDLFLLARAVRTQNPWLARRSKRRTRPRSPRSTRSRTTSRCRTSRSRGRSICCCT